MKKTASIVFITVLAVMSLSLTACGRTAFGVTGNTGKRITITAEKAEKNAFFLVGSLEADEGEEVVITSDLTKGMIRVEILGGFEQSIDALPDVDGDAILTADVRSTESCSGSVPAGTWYVKATCLERATGTVVIEMKAAKNEITEDIPADTGAGYGRVQSDLSDMTPELAGAYLSVVDELAARLGYEETEASEGEYLHGGFVRDWDGDGAPELCLLLKTSPRDGNGTPAYGWFPPTLYLYTVREGQALRVGECDLYFATGGREAAVAALSAGNGVQLVRWDRSEITGENEVYFLGLVNGELQQIQSPADGEEVLGADTFRAFLDALGPERVRPLLYNNSGETRIEEEANARELRAALAGAAT